ncbi:hypothetical protein PRUPE_4G261500 [Prunus persica]|uniref:Uncharacterized protein n=1 Tax=Prunus persica TaxID=3760 RepID=A0A251PR93_PRUPE|nr:hypothetical protein PRUPE_4G261500 [Prunus persica]
MLSGFRLSMEKRQIRDWQSLRLKRTSKVGRKPLTAHRRKKFDFGERLAIMNAKPDFRINHMGRACLHHNLILFIPHEVVIS